MTAGACMSSASVEWASPPWLVARLAAEFGPFDLDPAATAENACAPDWYCAEQDGLRQPWHGKVWCNPPYGRTLTGVWIRRMAEAADSGEADLVVGLVPARTDTAAWHECVMRAEEVRLIRGRLRFSGSAAGATFPSAVVIWRGPLRPAPDAPVRSWAVREEEER